MMRILIIMTTPMGYTGISSVVMNYYSYMDKADMQIDFVVPNKVEERFRNQIESNNGKIFELLMRNKNPIRYFIKLLKIIREGKYAIVHAHGNSSTLVIEILATKIAGVKYRIAHSHNTTCDHKIINKILRPFFLLSYTHALACSREAGKWMFRDRKYTVVPNGIDVQKFIYNDQIRNEYRSKYNLIDKKVIGHVGIFCYQKNHDYLIDIFYELSKLDSQYILVLIGEGELKPDIQIKVKNLGIEDKIIFLGRTSKIAEFLQAMDIMVLPSRFEGLPVVMVEWQCVGLPMVVSDKITKEAKLTELVEYIPLENSAKEWAKRIHEIKLLDRNDSKEAIIKEISKAGYDIRNNANKLRSIYKNIVTGEKS